MDELSKSARAAAIELCEKAGLKAGQIVVVGCSTSEIAGFDVGTKSNAEIGEAVFGAIYGVFAERGVRLAAQCCEHLNRALIIERETAENESVERDAAAFEAAARDATARYDIVNVVPYPGAGGAFAAAAYASLRDPVAIDSIQADAGLDIGCTLIGMHLKRVAVPLRLETTHIGAAIVTAARTRPPLIGGDRARYDEKLL